MKQFAPNLLLLDKFGSDSMESFISTVKHYVLNEECRVVFLDHFSLLADGIALNVDQRRAIDKAIKDLKDVGDGTRIHIRCRLPSLPCARDGAIARGRW